MSENKIYLPGLNGLRAIAAMGVLVAHITASLDLFNLNPYLLGHNANGSPEKLTFVGSFSVTIFFALSGFLITFLLLKEKGQQQISIKKFYARRILRIWPLYFLYLLITFITVIAFGLQWNWAGLLYTMLFLVNFSAFTYTSFPYAVHFWSLGVEEQFYLLWPWVIKLVNKNLSKVIFIVIIILLAIKLYARYYLGEHSALFNFCSNTRFQCMLIGAIGAVLFFKKNQFFILASTHKIVQLAAWLIILLALINLYHIASVFDNEIVSVVTLIIIVGQITMKNRFINLEKNIFNFIGTISYGIYVIHPLVLFFLEKILNAFAINSILKYFLVYFLGITVTILLAYVSYKYFEKRFLKMKKPFTVIKSLPVN